MVLKTRFRIEGAKELDKVLKGLPDHIAKRDLNFAVRKGANLLRDEAINRAPERTGYAKKNIKTRQYKKSGHSSTMLVGVFRKAYYMMFMEFGTEDTAAQPWLRPAFDATKSAVLKLIADTLAKRLQQSAKKLAGSYSKSGAGVRRRRKK